MNNDLAQKIQTILAKYGLEGEVEDIYPENGVYHIQILLRSALESFTRWELEAEISQLMEGKKYLLQFVRRK